MTNTDTKRRGRCMCGLKVVYHYSPTNKFLSCPEAQAAHPRAKIAPRSLRVLLCSSGATSDASPTIVTGLHLGRVVGAIVPRVVK